MPWLRAFAVWLVIIGAETLHGILRGLLIEPLVGDFRARQIAVFTGAAIILAIAYAFAPWLRAVRPRDRLGVGLLWLLLTLLFDLGLGRLVLRLSWERILSDYDLPRGGLLPLGLVALLLSPLIAGRLRRRRAGPAAA